jgi:hypothetical protein
MSSGEGDLVTLAKVFELTGQQHAGSTGGFLNPDAGFVFVTAGRNP